MRENMRTFAVIFLLTLLVFPLALLTQNGWAYKTSSATGYSVTFRGWYESGPPCLLYDGGLFSFKIDSIIADDSGKLSPGSTIAVLVNYIAYANPGWPNFVIGDYVEVTGLYYDDSVTGFQHICGQSRLVVATIDSITKLSSNPPPSCPYGGTYPDCNPPPSCPYGGTYPDCNPPPSQEFCLDIASATGVAGSRQDVWATISPSDASGCKYSAGQTVTLLAPKTSSDGYFFLAWLEDGAIAGTDTSLQVNMNSNHDVIAAYVDGNTLQNFVNQFAPQIGSEDYIGSVIKNIVNAASNGLAQTTIDSPSVADSMQPMINVLVALGAKGLKDLSEYPVVGFTIGVGSIANDVQQCSSENAGTSCNVQQVLTDLDGIAGGAMIGIAGEIICGVVLGVPTVGLGALACAIGPVLLAQFHAPGQQMNFEEWIGDNWHSVLSALRSDFCSFIQRYFPNKWFCVQGGSSVVLMVEDSGGRRTGGTLQEGNLVAYSEIPGAVYSGVDSHPQAIAVLQPLQAQYNVLVTGVGSGGSYSLTASLSDSSGSTVSTVSNSGFVSGGQTQSLSANIGSNQVTVSQSNGGTDTTTILATAVVTALIVLIGSEVILRRRRKR